MKKIGIDIGGTYTKISYLDKNNKIIKSCKIQSNFSEKEKYINELKNIFLQEGIDDVSDIRISSTGLIDNKGLIIASSIPEYLHYDWKKELKAIFKKDLLSLSINDANASSSHLISSVKEKDFVLITIGTGVGVSVVNDNKTIIGSNFATGEIGSLIWKDGLTIDKYFSASILNTKIKKLINAEEFSFSQLESIKNNSEVQEILSNYINELSKMISFIICLQDPEVIYISGGISHAPDFFFEQLNKQIQNHLPGHIKFNTLIKKSPAKNATNILGLFI